jgi:DNA-binding CsgD family transcriptional regulator
VSQQSFIVIEPADPAAFDRACAELIAAGLPLVATFDDARPGQVSAGPVTDRPTAQRAVLAALAGAHLVIMAAAAREVTDMLCDDLRRLGNLDHRVGAQPPGTDPPLGAGERALLERLLAGDSLGQAASALHLSRRTADRRLAAARRALGATTTAETLAIAVRRGLRPAAPTP